jgi:hypothetical protein
MFRTRLLCLAGGLRLRTCAQAEGARKGLEAVHDFLLLKEWKGLQSTFWRLCPRITEHIEKKTWIFYGLDTEENGKIGVEVKAQGAFFAAAGYEIVKLPNLKFDTTFPCLQRRSKCTQRSPHIHLPDWGV